MVRRDTEPNETPRSRETIDQVDLDAWVVAREQRPGGIEPGRPGADDGDAKRALAHAVNLGTSRSEVPANRTVPR